MHIRGGHGKGEQQLTALGTGRWTGREAVDPGAPRGTSRGGPTLEKPAPTRLPTPFLTTCAPAGLCLGDASGTRCPPQCSSASPLQMHSRDTRLLRASGGPGTAHGAGGSAGETRRPPASRRRPSPLSYPEALGGRTRAPRGPGSPRLSAQRRAPHSRLRRGRWERSPVRGTCLYGMGQEKGWPSVLRCSLLPSPLRRTV